MSLCLLLAAGSATLVVPTDYPTVQAAIDAAEKGDRVLVLPGIYEEQIDFLGKDILVESSAGPAATIFQGTKEQPIVSIVSGEGAGAVLRGFTLRHANVQDGAAVRCIGSSPRIEGNTITDNFGSEAVFCLDASPAILDNDLIKNHAVAIYVKGASAPSIEGNYLWRNEDSAVFLHGGTATIRGNVFEDNDAGFFGGGIHAQVNAALVIEQNQFVGNRAAHGGAISLSNGSHADVRDNEFFYNDVFFFGIDGGALYMSTASATVERCLFYGNRAHDGGAIAADADSNLVLRDCQVLAGYGFKSGGGVLLNNATALIERTLFSGNSTVDEPTSSAQGGAISIEGTSNVTVRQCELSGNRAYRGGALTAAALGTVVLEGLTVTGNTATFGGIVDVTEPTTVTLRHSIVWGNAGPAIAGGWPLTVEWSDVQGGWLGTGVIDADPLFADAAGGDYQLTAGSPCMDAGNPASVPAGLDALGTPRHLDGDLDLDVRIDMGAYERTHVRMTPIGHVPPGTSFLLEATGTSGLLAVCAFGAGTAEFFLDPWGLLLLNPAQLLLPVVLAPSLPIAVQVPIAPGYAGPPTSWFQTIVLDPATGAGNFSNRVSLEVP